MDAQTAHGVARVLIAAEKLLNSMSTYFDARTMLAKYGDNPFRMRAAMAKEKKLADKMIQLEEDK